MKLNVFKKGFNYGQDGPGNRLVYHLQGCTMHCAWCSNPEGMTTHGTLLVDASRLLAAVCPHGAIADGSLDRARCAVCDTRECLAENRNQGIRLSSQPCEIAELVAEARRSVPLYYDGGGVTLSGGEATLQFGVVRRFLQRLKDAGIHTALETNATHARLRELFPWLDYLIVDCKHYDDRRLRAATGVGLTPIERNLAHAFAERRQLLVRIALVGGFNDGVEDAFGFVRLFRHFDTRHAQFEFLAYHDYGRSKWAQCGLPYGIADGFIADGTIARFTDIFAENGLCVVRT